MCGIIGAYGQKHNLVDQLELMRHRGPDGLDITNRRDVSLGHTRLAIVDVDNGQQPMKHPDREVWLIANGEIYNHRDLRRRLPDFDYQTASDSEVILALYERYGAAGVQHLDGMFAFALASEDELVLARDPLGIKPLYYGWNENTLFFGSEIKAMQHLVDHIEEFPPGHWYSSKTGFQRYYDVIDVAREADTTADAVPNPEAIQHTLRRAVRKRLMSDVPLGVFLSGGLDSSIIAGLVSEELEDVHSFAVGYAEASEDIKYARKVAEHLGTIHHEYIYTTEEMIEALPDVIYHLESFDPSLVRSAVPNYFLARLARQHVTVVLSGEGADELYAGYEYYKHIDDDEALHQELANATSTLYSCNLLRCDRMTMAHSLEARVPFLDTDFIQLSFNVPVEQKIYGEEAVEKWVLRKAFEDIIPAEVAWRVKSQFSKGAGSSHVFEHIAAQTISDDAFIQARRDAYIECGQWLASKEELYYYRVFRQFFSAKAASLVQRWVGDDGSADALKLN